MSDADNRQIHVHHHYARPRASKAKKRRPKKAKKKPSEFKDIKKAISIGVNIIEQLLRLS